jgi:hypothetical protein
MQDLNRRQVFSGVYVVPGPDQVLAPGSGRLMICQPRTRRMFVCYVVSRRAGDHACD